MSGKFLEWSYPKVAVIMNAFLTWVIFNLRWIY